VRVIDLCFIARYRFTWQEFDASLEGLVRFKGWGSRRVGICGC